MAVGRQPVERPAGSPRRRSPPTRSRWSEPEIEPQYASILLDDEGPAPEASMAGGPEAARHLPSPSGPRRVETVVPRRAAALGRGPRPTRLSRHKRDASTTPNERIARQQRSDSLRAASAPTAVPAGRCRPPSATRSAARRSRPSCIQAKTPCADYRHTSGTGACSDGVRTDPPRTRWD